MNNVGTAAANMLIDMAWENVERLIKVNVFSMTVLSKIALPMMLARQNDKRSAIVNVSGKFSYFGVSGMAVYCGTKAYNRLFSESLALENQDKIDVLTVTAGSVKTNMNSGRYSFTVMPDSMARCSLNQLSWTNLTDGHPLHDFGRFLYPTPVGSVFSWIDKKRRESFLRERQEQENREKVAEGNN